MSSSDSGAPSAQNEARFAFHRIPIDIEHVYNWQPHVYDGLSFSFPRHARCSRTVRLRGTRHGSDKWYELWSPNSDRIDFYPGTPPEDEVLSAWCQDSFADGRLGPHDWSLHPQHFTVAAPWLGFCRRPRGYLQSWRDVDAELVPLPLIWLSSLTYPGYGKLYPRYAAALQTRAEFLGKSVAQFHYAGKVRNQDDERFDRVCRHRPDYPSSDDVSALVRDQYWKWEELVDIFTAVQRGLREMEGWLTMMQYWEERTKTISSDPLPPLKDNNRIGVWLNGAPEVDGLWLLRIGVIPIYVIHQYIEDIDFPKEQPHVPDRRSKNCRSDFVAGTFAELFNSMTNPYLDVFFTYSSGKTFKPIYRQGQHRKEADITSRLQSTPWAANLQGYCDRNASLARGDMACSTELNSPSSQRGVEPIPHTTSLIVTPASLTDRGRKRTTMGISHRAGDPEGMGEAMAQPSGVSPSLDKTSTDMKNGDRLEGTSDVVMSTDMSDPPVRNFEIVPELRCSPYIYLICGVEQSRALKDYLTAICDEHHSYSGIRSIHRDPLAVRDYTHTGFVIEFENSIRSAIIVKFLDSSNCGSWIYITADRAAQIVTEATDCWLAPPARLPEILPLPPKDSLPSSSRGQSQSFHSQQPPSQTLAPCSNQSAKSTRPAPSVRHDPVRTSHPHSRTSEQPVPSSSTHPEHNNAHHLVSKPRHSRRGAKKKRGGIREALFKKFGVKFWVLVDTISPEDFASCTPEEQNVILTKKAQRDAGVDNNLQLEDARDNGLKGDNDD